MVPYRASMRIAGSLLLSLTLDPQLPNDGKGLYEISCAPCHGRDGRGVDPSLVGFTAPVPDFTDCRFASREASEDWVAVTHQGGQARGFDSTMPAFGEAFDPEQIEKIIDFMRGFCTDTTWPRGELNLPLPLITEKAFPEDEVLWTTGVDVEGDGAFETELVYEKRVGARHQWEAAVVFGGLPAAEDTDWNYGIGDMALGWKSAFYHTPRTILSVGGEAVFPTGDESRGLGAGTLIFEPYVAFARVLPREWFLQGQSGAELPADTETAERELFWRVAIGRSWSAGNGYGRTWSPMVEVLGSADTGFEETSWTVLPQMQVALSTRQHVRVNVGVGIPMTRREERPTQLIFYFLWDWFDGRLLDGW